jgi:hypothetical protein
MVGSILHAAWNLNECFSQEGVLKGKTYEEQVQFSMKLFMEGVDVGTCAKSLFPRAVFNVGGSGKVWGSTKVYDLYAAETRAGLMSTGQCVTASERDYAQMELWKQGIWRYRKQTEWEPLGAAKFFADIIERDCMFIQMMQCGGRMRQQHECDTPLGRCKIAGDAYGRALMSADACGVGNCATSISPQRWALRHDAQWPQADWAFGSYLG